MSCARVVLSKPGSISINRNSTRGRELRDRRRISLLISLLCAVLIYLNCSIEMGRGYSIFFAIVQMQTEMVIVSVSSGSAKFIFSLMNKLDHRAARVHNRL